MKEVRNLINLESNFSSEVNKIKSNIVKDKVLLEYLKENNISLTESKVDNSLINLINFKENYLKCLNCEGLSFCSQQNCGYKPTLKDLKDFIILQYMPCKYQLAYESQMSIAANLHSFYMPKKILNASLDNVYMDSSDTARLQVIKKIANFALSYNINNYQKGIYLCGSFGVGKTYLLAAMANELVKRNITVGFVYFPDLIRELKSAIGSSKFESLIDDIKNVQVLILDDIGAEMNTSWMRDEILGPLLQYRLLQELPTFFTSNKTINELIKFYSQTNDNIVDVTKAERIGDRIRALANEQSIIGKNYRY